MNVFLSGRKLARCLVGVVAVLAGGASYATCNFDIAETTPFADFTDNGDGTVTHTPTGLMWMRCSLGQAWDGAQCTNSALEYSWAPALEVADEMAYAGHADWRLPNAKELATIVELSCYSPSLNDAVFPNTPPVIEYFRNYWTSTPASGSSNRAYVVDFEEGGNPAAAQKQEPAYVRLVRTVDGL